MKRVYLTDYDKNKFAPRDLFPLARPFWESNTTDSSSHLKNSFKKIISELNLEVVSSIENADFVLISEPLEPQFNKKVYGKLERINQLCDTKRIHGYAFISGDYGKKYPEFSNITYYRVGGFKSQLNDSNKALHVLLGDHLYNIFKVRNIIIREKEAKPIVGFCGHATNSIAKSVYEKLKLAKVNLERALVKDFCFEPLFSSALERYKLLKSISASNEINTNFILREKYRAGAVTDEERHKSTLEYYNNINESNYIICLRGSGNFSVRFYETLLMGRIPIFVNTDCLLPLDEEIDWKQHVVWVEWQERENIAEIILDFHRKLSPEEFIQKQQENRYLWLTKLTLQTYLKEMINFTHTCKTKYDH